MHQQDAPRKEYAVAGWLCSGYSDSAMFLRATLAILLATKLFFVAFVVKK
jgi:hypothetical protein